MTLKELANLVMKRNTEVIDECKFRLRRDGYTKYTTFRFSEQDIKNFIIGTLTSMKFPGGFNLYAHYGEPHSHEFFVAQNPDSAVHFTVLEMTIHYKKMEAPDCDTRPSCYYDYQKNEYYMVLDSIEIKSDYGDSIEEINRNVNTVLNTYIRLHNELTSNIIEWIHTHNTGDKYYPCISVNLLMSLAYWKI